MPKLYEAWPGQNRFLSFGCIMGPKRDTFANLAFYLCATWGLIFYGIFLFNDIWNASPAVPLLLFLAILLTGFFLNLTQCTDPGIIPRRCFMQKEGQKYNKYLVELPDGSNANRYCSTCRIYRPLRASHCSSCDNCVQVFDHHCPFVNNCIGKRNYRFFICFVGSVLMTGLSYFLNVIYYLVIQAGSQVSKLGVIIVCSVVVSLIAVPLLLFFIFHVYLIVTGRTTREVIKAFRGENS